MPTNPNLSQSVREQFRRALGNERSRLLEPVTRKIDVAGREGHVEVNLLKLQLLDAEKHPTPRRRER